MASSKKSGKITVFLSSFSCKMFLDLMKTRLCFQKVTLNENIAGVHKI